jgi:hypothetical protein
MGDVHGVCVWWGYEIDCELVTSLLSPLPVHGPILVRYFGERVRSCAEYRYVGRWVFGLGWDFGHVELASLLFLLLLQLSLFFSRVT